MNLQLIVDDFYQELQGDYVGLWQLVHVISRRAKLEPAQVCASVLRVAAKLLQRENVVAGQFEALPGKEHKDWRFVVWNEDPEQALKRIDEEWRSLGHPPIIGDICWFALIIKDAKE